MGRPLLLVLVFITEEHRALVAKSFDLIYAPNADQGRDRTAGAAVLAARGDAIEVVLTNGTNGLLASEMALMPRLRIVCTLGVGHENVDVAHARSRGIPVCNAAGTNEACVADHAMGLLLAAMRGIPAMSAGVRDGLWRDAMPRPPQVSGRRLGIFGLGTIGRLVARRAAAFDLDIGYHGRTRRDDAGFRFFASLHELAAWADILLVAAPGGADTFHAVNAAVLLALGPRGVLVNIARGSLVDTDALATALAEGTIAAAGLDVYESEPAPPAALLRFPNAVITPHVGGISPEAIEASVRRFIDNATRHFEGRPLLTPVA